MTDDSDPMGGDTDPATDDGIVDAFQRASTVERSRMVGDDALAPTLRAHLGDDAYDEYRELAGSRRPRTAHLGAATPKNVVFVPGVMGSLLENRTRGGVSWIDVRTIRNVDSLRLAPDGRSDADPDDRIAPFNVDVTYAPFLTAALQRDDLGVELFPYDWRKPLAASSERLRDLVASLHAENGGRSVHLVAHSMGGLMVRTALARHGDEMWPLLGRIVFVGTPHFGSPAIASYLKNHFWGFELMAVLGVFLKRATFRSLWGVLNMLPAPCGVYPDTRASRGSTPVTYEDHPCVNFDPYTAASWRLDLTRDEEAQLQSVLDGATTAHRDLWQAHHDISQDQRDRMLSIVGVGHRTLFRLAYEKRFFGLWERADKVLARVAADPHRDGDGRVPLASAALDWTTTRYVRGLHGSLMSLPSVQSDVFAFLTGQRLDLPTTPKGALAGHLGSSATSPAPALDGSGGLAAGGEPDLWSQDGLDAQRLEDLLTSVEQGHLPEIERIRIL